MPKLDKEQLADILYFVHDARKRWYHEFEFAAFPMEKQDAVIQFCRTKGAPEEDPGVHRIHWLSEIKESWTADDLITVLYGRMDDLVYDLTHDGLETISSELFEEKQ